MLLPSNFTKSITLSLFFYTDVDVLDLSSEMRARFLEHHFAEKKYLINVDIKFTVFYWFLQIQGYQIHIC